MSRLTSSVWWALAIVSLVGVAGYFFWPDFSRREDLRQEEKRLNTRIEVEERKNQLLQREEEELRGNPDYVEKVAREKLGLVKSDEIIYKFEDGENEH